MKDMSENKVNILMVDDKKANLDALEYTLEELGENLVRAQSGKEALKQLLNKEFAVILLDVQMPVMDGFETASLIRKRKKSEHLPIILLTAFDKDNPQVLKGYSAGAVDYIIKPYNPQIVVTKVKVFVDLFRMREEIIQQKEIEAEQLRAALSSHHLLTGWQKGSVTAKMAGVGSLRERSPEVFSALKEKYLILLDAYLEAVGFKEAPPRGDINVLAERIGSLGGGPRDVVDVHLHSVQEICKDVHPKRELAYTVEGRLLALELMGYLVDYYRANRFIQQNNGMEKVL